MREFSCVLGARFHAAAFLDGPFLPLSLSLSLSLSPSFPLISTADDGRRRARGLLRRSAWLLDLLHLATERLCPPCASIPLSFPPCPAVRLGRLSPSLPLSILSAVGLGIKIRHFIVSKFCEADNIAAPIAAQRKSGNPSVLVLLPHK